jgi:hypothetical protein
MNFSFPLAITICFALVAYTTVKLFSALNCHWKTSASAESEGLSEEEKYDLEPVSIEEDTTTPK